MNKIITNLALIADAAEYFDKKTGAAWKIRSCLTNMAVWGANGYLAAVKTESAENIVSAMIPLATIRCWLKDCNTSGFILDLTSGAVRRTLGLEREIDVHAEATRTARNKCIQTRNALRFKEFYDAAAAALDEQRRTREARVEEIAFLLADDSFPIDVAIATELDQREFTVMEFDQDAKVGKPMQVRKTTMLDEDLYDDGSVERQADQLAETIGNCLESMYDVCDAELAAAITTDKINRLTGFYKAIMQMMDIAGVDTKRLAERRAKLEAQIETQIAEMNGTVADINAQIDEQIAHLQTEAVVQEPAAPTKGKRRRVTLEEVRTIDTAPQAA